MYTGVQRNVIWSDLPWKAYMSDVLALVWALQNELFVKVLKICFRIVEILSE